MKLFHLSDLHIGKTLNGYSLAKNQEMVLAQVVSYAKKERPDVILLCGDIYDRSVPSGEAHEMFDGFLTDLSDICPAIPVLIIAGNHDSPQRLAYAEQFLEKHKIYISTMPPTKNDQFLKKVTIEDDYGPVNFYLLPFVKPGYLRELSAKTDSYKAGEHTGEDNTEKPGRISGEDKSEKPGEHTGEDNSEKPAASYEAAIEFLIEREHIDYSERNVLLSHQFYTGQDKEMELCESEQAVIMAGGLDKISSEVVKAFDYVALGHLHGKQQAGYEHIRYCGTPYKYSVSEENHNKSITVITMKEKGSALAFDFLPLKGEQDVRRIKGTFEEVAASATKENCHDYVSVTITDEEEPYHFREKLKEIYEYLLEVRVDNQRTREKLSESWAENGTLSPMETFALFYETIHHKSMTEEEKRVMELIWEQVKEAEQ